MTVASPHPMWVMLALLLAGLVFSLALFRALPKTDLPPLPRPSPEEALDSRPTSPAPTGGDPVLPFASSEEDEEWEDYEPTPAELSWIVGGIDEAIRREGINTADIGWIRLVDACSAGDCTTVAEKLRKMLVQTAGKLSDGTRCLVLIWASEHCCPDEAERLADEFGLECAI